MVRIHDLATDTITDREMTDEEFAQHEANQAADAALKVAEAEAKAAAQAKLTALGLTVEDLQALGL
jgi:hypothetical protein